MIILFDLDSTLVKIEGLDEIAAWKGMQAEITAITMKTMSGELDFDVAFPEKVRKLAPSVADLEKMSELYLNSLTQGAVETLATLKNLGIVTGIITHNFRTPALRVAEHLGIQREYVFANEIQHDEVGKFLSYDDKQILARDTGKKEIIAQIRAGKQYERIYFVGDSIGDMKTADVADGFIGFGGVVERQSVKDQAKTYIYEMPELFTILPLAAARAEKLTLNTNISVNMSD